MMLESEVSIISLFSDLLIGICYYVIPIQMGYFLRQCPYKVDNKYSALILLIGAFITLCGTIHFGMVLIHLKLIGNIEILYYLKLLTAAVSLLTTFTLFRLIPQLLLFAMSSLNLNIKLQAKLLELDHINHVIEAARRLKREFISTISHELRNPLFIITANAGFLLESTSIDEENGELIRCISNSARLMTSIVNDVLDMNRFKAGRMSFETIPINLLDICTNLVKSLQIQAHAKNVYLSCEYEMSPERLRYFLADPTRIHQLILNFLSNSLKFSHPNSTVDLLISQVDSIPFGNSPYHPYIPIIRPLSSVSLVKQRQEELDSLTNETLKLIETSNEKNEQIRANNKDDIQPELLNKVIPGISSSLGFTLASKSICLDYFHHKDTTLGEHHSSFATGKELNIQIPLDIAEEEEYELLRESIIVKFTVQDHGVGMSPEVLSRLFIPYTQAKLSTVREHGGTGLGLSICSEIIRNLNGCIQVTSEVGRGSEFSFYLTLPLSSFDEWEELNRTSEITPLIANRTLNQKKSSSLSSSSSSSLTSTLSSSTLTLPSLYLFSSSPSSTPVAFPTPSSPTIPIAFDTTESHKPMSRKILVVDDNEMNRKILKRMLDSLGWKVSTANDGLQAIDAVKYSQKMSDPYFCIFMDISVPNMNGYEASRHIRQLKSEIHIVALTANSDEGEVKKSQEAGMTRFLTKPIRKEEIASTLRSLINTTSQVAD